MSIKVKDHQVWRSNLSGHRYLILSVDGDHANVARADKLGELRRMNLNAIEGSFMGEPCMEYVGELYQFDDPPKNKQEGLCNAVKMAYNQLMLGNDNECKLNLENIIDDVCSKSNPYRIGGSKRRPVPDNYRGDVNAD